MTDHRKAIEKYLRRTGFTTIEPIAALIDMDGTLYDSMRNHTAAWHRLISELGIPCTRDEFYLYEGMTGAQTINRLFNRGFGRDATDTEKAELYHRKTVYFSELPEVSPMPGARKLLDTMIERDIRRVLVTGSGQQSVIDRLNRDFPGAFSKGLRVTARDVVHGKPAPEPYLKGMEKAGVRPHNSIAIENAPLGVRSAVDAGAFTIAVTTGPIPCEEMEKSGADIIYDSMPRLADDFPALLDHLAGAYA